MRPLEYLLIALILLSALVAFFAPAARKVLTGLCVLTFAAFALHATFGGIHWQMAPAYIAALLTIVLSFASKRLLRYVAAISIVLLVAASCAFSIYLPIFQLPTPTGPYAIGTQVIPLVNPHPSDPSFAQHDGSRPLMIQIWYPAAPSKAPRASYRTLAETTLLSSYQTVVPTHTRWSAPLPARTEPFPVLLLNPAYQGRRTYYMYLVEDLVSYGYIVVGVDHPGITGPIAFPDGHVSNPEPDPRFNFDILSLPQLRTRGAELQAIQVDDDRFVLDQIDRWNQDPSNFFFHHLDTDRVAALGHSIGGSVAAEDCLDDPRFKAAFDMDGSFWGPVLHAGIATPLMMIEEDYAPHTSEELKNDRAAIFDYTFDSEDDVMMSKSNGYQIFLHGSSHVSFTDRGLFSPFRRYSGQGTVPVLRQDAIVRSYALAFFNKTLKGIDSPLLSPDAHTYPEATLRVLHR
jgi:pimeloyl-ACP methyl ester carboxylesterase